MRILVVGASGIIGSAVDAELSQRHEVITAGRSSGDLRIDITDTDSIRSAYQEVGQVDAVVCCAGHAKWAPMAEMTADDYQIGLQDKLMGQVNLVLEGRDVVAEGGSFTLTTGVLDRAPIIAGSSASMVNNAISGFVMAAAIELPRSLRINAVSPGVIEEAVPKLASYFRGFKPVPAARAALAYARAVEGAETGKVYEVD